MGEHPIPYEAVRALIAADDDYATFTRPHGYQPLSEGRAENLLKAAASLLGDAAARREAEVRQVIATFLTVRGGGEGAGDLAEAVRQVLDRDKGAGEEGGAGDDWSFTDPAL